MHSIKSGFPILAATALLASWGAALSASETNEAGGQASVDVDGATYSFAGTCTLMRRGNAAQLRMTAPGTGPDGAAMFLTLFATSQTPAQYVIHAGPTPEAAREAAMADDRTVWQVRGAMARNAVEFAEEGLSAAGVADIISDGASTAEDVAVRIEISGC